MSNRALVLGLAALACAAPAIPAAWAGPKVVKPFAAESTAPEVTKAAPKMPWRDLDEGLAEAKRDNKPILVDVYTDWCGWCKRMDRTTYTDAAVLAYVEKTFVPIKLDAEEEGRRASYDSRLVSWRQFADGFGVTGYPTTLFLQSDGRLITKVPGFVQPDRFLSVLRYVGDGHYKKEPWDVYDKKRTEQTD